jgi:hypothetical protein
MGVAEKLASAAVIVWNLNVRDPTVSVTVLSVLGLVDAFWRTHTVVFDEMDPGELVNPTPVQPMEYRPPELIEIGVGPEMPINVIVFDSTRTPTGTLPRAGNVAWFVVSQAPVVTAKDFGERPATFKVAVIVVRHAPELVRLSVTLSPGLTVPAELVNGPLLMRYWPPAMLIAALVRFPTTSRDWKAGATRDTRR